MSAHFLECGDKSPHSRNGIVMQKQNARPRKAKNGPQVSRPVMPASYGIAADGEFLPWSDVDERLAEARNYWVSTTRPDGRPHAMPVWGVLVDGKVTFGTDRQSRKARNLASNLEVVIHLESGDEVAIIEGTVEEVTDRKLVEKINAAYKKKYGMRISDIPGDLALYAVRPRVAFAWREKDFNQFATRWNFS